MASPPKPWERSGSASPPGPQPLSGSPAQPLVPLHVAAARAGATHPSAGSPQQQPPGTAVTSSQSNPNGHVDAVINKTTSPGPPQTVPVPAQAVGPGMSQFGSFGGYAPTYSPPPPPPPYGRLGTYGGYGSGVYGGYGGYGGMYGNNMYSNMPSMGFDPNNPNSLTQQFGQSTQATFQMLQGLVSAFTGFAQMLESTYMTTHSSFFAMIAVAEQFSNLRNTLGNVIGLFTLFGWLRKTLATLTGRALPVDAASLNPSNFTKFQGSGASVPAESRPSRKPLLFFVLAAFGLPFLIKKLIRFVASQAAVTPSLNPSQVEFCRALWDYQPAAPLPGSAVGSLELPLKKGDLVAILSKCDPAGNPSAFWKCRARNGSQGFVPAAYLESVQKGPHHTPPAASAPVQAVAIQAPEAAPSPAAMTPPAVLPATAAAAAAACAHKLPNTPSKPLIVNTPQVGGRMPPSPPPEKSTS